MNVAPFSHDQGDTMQEITNIAMGQAGSLIATLLGTFVNLSVPQVNVLALPEIAATIGSVVGRGVEVTAVRQSFHGYLHGEAIVIYDRDGCKDLGDLMGYDQVLDRSSELELLLDIGNIVVGACLGGIVDQIKGMSESHSAGELNFSAPSLMAEGVPADVLIDPEKLTWSHALLLEVKFSIEGNVFTSHLCALMTGQSIKKIKSILDEFIASI